MTGCLTKCAPYTYRLKLPHGLRQLHPVFNVVKLSTTLDNPIPGREPQALLPPIVVDGEPEWEVEEVLNSRWYRRRFQFLIKWKGFSRVSQTSFGHISINSPSILTVSMATESP